MEAEGADVHRVDGKTVDLGRLAERSASGTLTGISGDNFHKCLWFRN